MRRLLLWCCSVFTVSWLVVGCGDSRLAYVVDDDGQLRRQTPELMQSRDEDRLRRLLQDADPAIVSVQVQFSQAPRAVSYDDAPTEWLYDQVQAAITVAVPVADAADLSQRLHDETIDFLRARRRRASSAIAATVEVVEPTAVPGRPYTIQAGDTVADISTAFYGSPEHWRSIIRANPGLDAANLPVGTTIMIPERDQPAVDSE